MDTSRLMKEHRPWSSVRISKMGLQVYGFYTIGQDWQRDDHTSGHSVEAEEQLRSN